MPSKAAKRSQQVLPKYQILARPNSSDTGTSQSIPELWHFKIPRHRARGLPSSSDTITSQCTPKHQVETSQSSPEPQVEKLRYPSSATTSSLQAMPVTPTRPASMHIIPSHGQHQSESSVPAVKPHQHNQASSTSPSKRPAYSTSKSATRRKPQTPARSSATPSQAYAGPTFHASPAASALPMPTFFLSKSVPEQKKSSGLKAMMDREGNEESSDQTDESPTLRKSQLVSTQPFRKESPLDFFFQADRRKKEEDSTKNVLSEEPGILSPATSASYLTDSSQSPGSGTNRSSHTPSSSVGGLFPLDSEDPNRSSPTSKQRGPLQRALFRDLERTVSTPAALTAHTSHDEQTKTKTLALKSLLLSPIPQRPATASPHSRVSVSDNHVPQALPLPHNPSGPSTPSFHLDSESTNHRSPTGFPFSENSPYNSPYNTPSSRSPRHRPNPSTLRQQVTTARTERHSPAKLPPATILHNESPNLLNRQSCAAALQNGTCRTSKPNVSSQNSVPGIHNTPLRDPAQMKLMEDYLRRVLQLDTLGSDGAKGVAT